MFDAEKNIPRRADTEARRTGPVMGVQQSCTDVTAAVSKGASRKAAFTKSYPTGCQWDFPGCVQGRPGTAGDEKVEGKEQVFSYCIIR